MKRLIQGEKGAYVCTVLPESLKAKLERLAIAYSVNRSQLIRFILKNSDKVLPKLDSNFRELK